MTDKNEVPSILHLVEVNEGQKNKCSLYLNSVLIADDDTDASVKSMADKLKSALSVVPNEVVITDYNRKLASYYDIDAYDSLAVANLLLSIEDPFDYGTIYGQIHFTHPDESLLDLDMTPIFIEANKNGVLKDLISQIFETKNSSSMVFIPISPDNIHAHYMDTLLACPVFDQGSPEAVANEYCDAIRYKGAVLAVPVTNIVMWLKLHGHKDLLPLLSIDKIEMRIFDKASPLDFDVVNVEKYFLHLLFNDGLSDIKDSLAASNYGSGVVVRELAKFMGDLNIMDHNDYIIDRSQLDYWMLRLNL